MLCITIPCYTERRGKNREVMCSEVRIPPKGHSKKGFPYFPSIYHRYNPSDIIGVL